MQVHYNLLAGAAPTAAPSPAAVGGQGSRRTPLQTMLLPAPVELPCRDNRTEGLRNRTVAGRRPQERFAEEP